MIKRLLLSALVAIWLPGCAVNLEKKCTLGCGSFEDYRLKPLNKEIVEVVPIRGKDLTVPPNASERLTEETKDALTNPNPK